METDKETNGFEIFIVGVVLEVILMETVCHNYCENVVITANHTGGWFTTGPHGENVAANPPDESREAFYKEITGEGSGDCVLITIQQQASHNGVQLVKIGRVAPDCMNGTTTITAQNQEGQDILMWIRTEENQETLGMLIPGLHNDGHWCIDCHWVFGYPCKNGGSLAEVRLLLQIQVITSLEPHPMMENGLQNCPNSLRRLKIKYRVARN